MKIVDLKIKNLKWLNIIKKIIIKINFNIIEK
jgi:hypothetical protein